MGLWIIGALSPVHLLTSCAANILGAIVSIPLLGMLLKNNVAEVAPEIDPTISEEEAFGSEFLFGVYLFGSFFLFNMVQDGMIRLVFDSIALYSLSLTVFKQTGWLCSNFISI